MGKLFTSTNGGATWIERRHEAQLLAVAWSGDGSRLVVGGLQGLNATVWASADGGATWTPPFSLANMPFSAAVASSASGDRLVAAATNGYLATSADGGATWTQRTGAPGPDCMWWAVASSADGAKLAATHTGSLVNSVPGGVWTSTDGGATWTDRSAALRAADANGRADCRALASSADGARLVAACKGAVLVSADAGATWAVSKRWLGSADAVASSADGSRLLAADNSGGTPVHTSTNGGASWTTLAALGRLQYTGWRVVAVSADGMRLAVGGGATYIHTSTDGGATWDPPPPPPPPPTNMSRWAGGWAEAQLALACDARMRRAAAWLGLQQ